jgi:aldehyde dehydrogenase (NAD+)
MMASTSAELLKSLGLTLPGQGSNSGVFGAKIHEAHGAELKSFNPATGELIGRVTMANRADYELVVKEAEEAFLRWRKLPAPRRGELVRLAGERLREHKDALGRLVTLEMGKILQEGLGEVQEAIDIADYAVGLSRQLYGVTTHSERPLHRLFEQWHPLGLVGCITAFNFPVAVWAWNAMLALVCGDAVVWKPSEKTPLTAIATTRLLHDIFAKEGCGAIISMLIGDLPEVGHPMIHDRRFPLISATGSCRMGREVGAAVAARLGRSILELGGNNAVIVLQDANLDLALRAVLFGACGTAGQRCTTTRRLFLHESIAADFTAKLVKAYETIPIGDPMSAGTLVGPLIDADAVAGFETAIAAAKAQGGEVLVGGEKKAGAGNFVKPTIIRARPDMDIVRHETFAPILYVMSVRSLEEAIAAQNAVDQGLSSAIFTNDMRSAERFLCAEGSDCGIANVNLGTSGAEIGLAFGGEKDTGGGREAGSDSWKAYMRRQTNTMNYGADLPLAQGIQFG